MPGQLWVIEGADGSGKQTQAKLLVERLNKSENLGANKAHFWSFPTYEDPVWGKLLKEYLGGEQKADEVDPKYASLLYAADRGKAAPKIKELLAKGDWVICDRYAQSNMAHQGAKIRDELARNKFLKWLEEMEFIYFDIPKPDGIIYLSLPIEVSQKRAEQRLKEAEARGETLGDKVKKRDVHEQDTEYLERVRNEYQRLAELQNWHIIECVENGHELTPEEISDKIWKVIYA
jgi:dTMP kinase